MDTIERRLAALERQVNDMDLQLERASAQLLGLKLALTCAAPLIHATQRDATAACEVACSLADELLSESEAPHATALLIHSTIRDALAMIGSARRDTRGSP